MLQTLVDTALALCRAGSAGFSLHEQQPSQPETFRWIAASGQCARLVGHVIPTDESPGGLAFRLGAPRLISFPKLVFPCLSVIEPDITEELVVPVPGRDGPRGALWVLSHDREIPMMILPVASRDLIPAMSPRITPRAILNFSLLY